MVVSLHLPMILAKARKESKDFYEVLDYYLELIRNLHKKTYEFLSHKKASTNPLGYCYGGFLNGNKKPNEELAKQYIADGNYYWNSGIFMFKASTILSETSKHAPEIAKIADEFDFSENNQIPFVDFDKMPNISIDYAVMEKSDNIALVKLESDWYDIGSWQAIYDVSKKDENGNVFVGHVLDKNSKNSFVYASSKLVTGKVLKNFSL